MSVEEITGSHEEFWTFSQVSQWGSHWRYSSHDHLNLVRDIVIRTRSIGLKLKLAPRMVHFAQMLLWRFYLKESTTTFPAQDIIPLALESSAQILETQSPLKSVKEILGNQSNQQTHHNHMSEFRCHFQLLTELNFNIRIHHPSEYLHLYVNSSFTNKEYEIAECIIADSYLCPCCLVHLPTVIAEGAAIMAAGMNNNPHSVIPRSAKAISFIQDMKCFYQQTSQSQHN